MLAEVIGNKYVFDYCSKINGVEIIVNKVKKLISQKQNEHNSDIIKDFIKNELESLKFDFSYIGTRYLYECICECYNKKYRYDINLKTEIYPIISKKYHKTVNSIKASIFQATSIMYYEISESDISAYFGYHVINKPKPKDIIFVILQKINFEDETLF